MAPSGPVSARMASVIQGSSAYRIGRLSGGYASGATPLGLRAEDMMAELSGIKIA